MGEKIKEFLFKEYEFSYNTLKNLTEFSDRWFRFYIIMISAVGSFLIYIFTKYPPEVMKVLEQSPKVKEVLEKCPEVKEVLEQQNIPLFGKSIFHIAGLLLLVLFIAGIGVLLIEFRVRIRTVECYNTINRVRKYFVDRFMGEEEASKYLEYPYKDTERQKVFEWKNVFKVNIIISFMIIIINTVVGSVGVFFLLKSNICLNILLPIAFFLLQVVLLWWMYKQKKRQEEQKEINNKE
jgi:ABC-type multidrug transport system fused ATPase/permease subunit